MFLFGGNAKWINILAMVLFGVAIGVLIAFHGGLMAIDLVPRKASGAAWGIPSKAQWQELIDECDWTWDSEELYTEMGSIGGLNGYRVTSKKNGASIFLLAAGYQDDDSKGKGISGVNASGWYWTNIIVTQKSRHPRWCRDFCFDLNNGSS